MLRPEETRRYWGFCSRLGLGRRAKHQDFIAFLAARGNGTYVIGRHRTLSRFWQIWGHGVETMMKTIFVILALSFAFATGMAITTVIAQIVS